MTENTSFEDLKQYISETSRQMRETDRQMKETDRQMKKTDRQISRLREQIGHLGNRLGEFIEGVVQPGLVRIFRERGLEVSQTHRGISARRGDLAAEVDLLVVDGDVAVAIEVKSKLTTQDVDEHLARLGKFKVLFPQYKEWRLQGGVAAMVLQDDVVRYAERRGLFVIGQTGEDAAILNATDFVPRAW